MKTMGIRADAGLQEPIMDAGQEGYFEDEDERKENANELDRSPVETGQGEFRYRQGSGRPCFGAPALGGRSAAL